MTQFLICPHMTNLKVWFIKGKDKISTTSLWLFPISFSTYATELSTWYSSHISSPFILYHRFPNSFGFLSTTRFLFQTLTSRQWSLSVGKLLWLKNRRLSKTITHGIFSFCPSNARPIGHKWVYKIMIESNGSLDKYKAFLVALGYRQEYRIGYNEIFAPVNNFGTCWQILTHFTSSMHPYMKISRKQYYITPLGNKIPSNTCLSISMIFIWTQVGSTCVVWDTSVYNSQKWVKTKELWSPIISYCPSRHRFTFGLCW